MNKQELIEAQIQSCTKVLADHDVENYLDGPVKYFVDHCYANKADLINQLGGWRRALRVSSAGNTPITQSKLEALLYEQNLVSPGLLPKNDSLNWEASSWAQHRLAKEAMELYFPPPGCSCQTCLKIKEDKEKVCIKIRKGQSIAKAVLSVAPSDKKDSWRLLFALLGQYWATQNDKQKWIVSISAAPSSFLRLGHYGEAGSCFKFGGEWQRAKAVLAQLPRQVVILFYKEPDDGYEIVPGQPIKLAVAGRAWGALGNEDNPGILISNIYMIEKTLAYTLTAKIVRELFGVGDVVEKIDDISTRAICGTNDDDVYCNNDECIYSTSATFESYLAQENRRVDVSVHNNNSPSCSICNEQYDEDDGYYCESCNWSICTYCGFYDEAEARSRCRNCASRQSCAACNASGSSLSLRCLSDDDYVCESGDCSFLCYECNYEIANTQCNGCKHCEENICDDCFSVHSKQCKEAAIAAKAQTELIV